MTIEKIAEAKQNVIATIRKVAADANVDFNYLLAQAKIESGLNPAARAGSSSALGLYQFTSGTWLSMVRQYGDRHGLDDAAQALRDQTANSEQRAQILELRKQPEISSAMAAQFALDNAKALVASGHKAIGPTELYLAHFLGSSGANTFLNGLRDTPSNPAAAALPAAAAANPNIFYSNGTARSFRDIHAMFAQKFNYAIASAEKSEAIAANDAARMATKLPQALSVARINEIAKSTLSAASNEAGADHNNSTPAVSQEVMASFLRGFSQDDTNPGLKPLESETTRDASQGATQDTHGSAMPAENVSPLALGAQLILRSADKRTDS